MIKLLNMSLSERIVKVYMGTKRKAFKTAFPMTLPICAGFSFLGMAYGIYMNSKGFSFIYPMLMSMTIFAGSMEFVVVNLLLISFQPFVVLGLTLMVNARHLFYGLSMLDKYKEIGKKKWYLIYGMCDESFSINCSADIPEDVDKGWFMFFVTMLNQIYWVTASTIGGIMGSYIHFDTKGLEFVMTALFVVIFLDQWLAAERHIPAITGLAIAALSLVIFGSTNFIIPAMAGILLILTLLRNKLSTGGEKVERNYESKG